MKRKIDGVSHQGKIFAVGQVIEKEKGTRILDLLYYNEIGREFVDIRLSTGQTLRMFEPDNILFDTGSEHGFHYDDRDAEGFYLDQLEYKDVVGKKMDEVYENYSNWCEEHCARRLPKHKIKTLIRDSFGLVYAVKRKGNTLDRVFLKQEDTIQKGD